MAILIKNKIHFSFDKIISDKNGRYLIAVGTLMNNPSGYPVIVMNLYAPNFDSVLCVNNLLANRTFAKLYNLFISKHLWEDLFELKPYSKVFISQIHTIIAASGNHSIKNIASKWEQELGFKIGKDYWDKITDRIRISSSCARLSLIQFKTEYNLHYQNQDYQKYIPVCVNCAADGMPPLVI